MARPGTGPSPARQATGPSPIAPNAARSATGPTPAYAGTGPIPTRAATGPTPARPATGPSPARPAAGLAQPGFSQSSGSQPTVAQPSLTRAGLGQASFGHASPAQPSFQPNTARVPGRQPERPDWNERTERIDRIVPGAYPDPRHSARSQAPSSAAVSSSAQLSVWGRDDSADRRVPDVREPARHGVTGANAPARRNEDDPLTSKAWSREELVNTDGRSYRVASRRAHVTPDQYTAALTEQTQTFSMNGQYPADPLGATGAYPVRGGQPGQPGQHQGQQSQQSQQGRQSQQRGQHRRQPGPYDQGTASYPYPVQPYSARPSATDQDEDRHGRPSRSAATDAGYNRGADYNRGNGGNDYGGDGGRHNGNGGYNGGYGNGRY